LGRKLARSTTINIFIKPWKLNLLKPQIAMRVGKNLKSRITVLVKRMEVNWLVLIKVLVFSTDFEPGRFPRYSENRSNEIETLNLGGNVNFGKL